MDEQKNTNTGTGPSEQHYGSGKDGTDNTSETNRSEQTRASETMKSDGVSGRKDQEENARNNSDVPGHDDQDKFDMDSLTGKIGE